MTAEASTTAAAARREAALKGRWLTVSIISLLQLTENSEGGVVNTVFPIIRAGLNLSLSALGTLTAVGKFARMLTGPMWAVLVGCELSSATN